MSPNTPTNTELGITELLLRRLPARAVIPELVLDLNLYVTALSALCLSSDVPAEARELGDTLDHFIQVFAGAVNREVL